MTRRIKQALLAVGALGVIYRSTDSGVSWTKVTGTTELNGSCPTPGEVN